MVGFRRLLDIVFLSALMRTLHLPGPLVRALEHFMSLDEVTKIGVITILTILVVNAIETCREATVKARRLAPACLVVARACARLLAFKGRRGA